MPIRKSRVSGIVASGTTADRPSNPSIGDTFFNGTLGVQEIYTTSGWLPATGANDFNVVLTGSETSVTLDKEYFAGAYTIASALSDTTFDIYLFDTSNNSAGYSNSPSINATNNFNKIMVYGGTNGDLLSFSYKTTFTTSATTTDTFAAPYIASISVADLPNIDDTTTITGGNFDTDIEVWFDGANNYSQQAKSVVYGSSTSIVATRPDDLLEDNAPYTLRVINPGTTSPTGSNRNKFINGITAGGDPVWITASGALESTPIGQAYSKILQATDPDGGTISYQIASGSLPNGLSLNSLTGEISGSSTSVENPSFVISAIDSGGNIVNRSFSIESSSLATGGTVSQVGGYTVHTFTSSGTFIANASIASLEYLIVGGGGAGGEDIGGGGGAGGLLSGTTSVSSGSYSIVIGAGGASGRTSGENGGKGNSGNSSTAFGLTALRGGAGGGEGSNTGEGGSGSYGSGGGAGYSIASGGAGTSGQGNSGGSSDVACGGGGGAGSSGVNGINGGAAGDGGAGVLSTIDGNSYYYAAGGGASGWSNTTRSGNGGIGGGGGGGGSTGSYTNPGSGGSSARNPGSGGNGGNGGNAGANTGSGGGGAGESNASTNKVSGAGGSGIVIVRYAI